MTEIEKAAELHERYGPLDYPIDVEDIARREGLTITNWPLLPPVEEVKVGQNVGLRDGLSSEWRRWDIAHVLGHHLLLHRGNQLVFRTRSDKSKKMRQTSSLPIFLCLRRSF
jgi:hypothetical protein